MDASAARTAATSTHHRRRSSGQGVSARLATNAATAEGVRMTIAERRAHTMKVIETLSGSTPSSPTRSTPRACPRSIVPVRRSPAAVPSSSTSSTPRACPRSGALARRPSVAPRMSAEPTRAPAQASVRDRIEAPAQDQAPEQETSDQVLAPALDFLQVPAPEHTRPSANEDKISRLEAMVVVLQHQVETIQAARKCNCCQQLDVVANSIVTLENTIFSVHDKLMRLEEHVVAKMECWEDRVKAQVVAFHADTQGLADSLAALKDELKTSRMPWSPPKLSKQGICRAMVSGAVDNFRSSSYTSVASGSSYSSAAASSYTSMASGSSHTSVASSSYISVAHDSAAAVDTSNGFEQSNASTSDLSQSAIDFFLALSSSERQADEVDYETYSRAVDKDPYASVVDADMAPMLCMSDLY